MGPSVQHLTEPNNPGYLCGKRVMGFPFQPQSTGFLACVVTSCPSPALWIFTGTWSVGEWCDLWSSSWPKPATQRRSATSDFLDFCFSKNPPVSCTQSWTSIDWRAREEAGTLCLILLASDQLTDDPGNPRTVCGERVYGLPFHKKSTSVLSEGTNLYIFMVAGRGWSTLCDTFSRWSTFWNLDEPAPPYVKGPVTWDLSACYPVEVTRWAPFFGRLM